MGGKCLQYLGFIRQSGPGTTVLVSIWFCKTPTNYPRKLTSMGQFICQICLRGGEEEGRRCCLLITKRDRANGEKQHGPGWGKNIKSFPVQILLVYLAAAFKLHRVKIWNYLYIYLDGVKLHWTKTILNWSCNQVITKRFMSSQPQMYELMSVWGLVEKYADGTFWVIAAKNYSNNSAPWWSRRL